MMKRIPQSPGRYEIVIGRARSQRVGLRWRCGRVDGLKRHTCGGHGLVWKDVSPKGNGLLGVLLMFTLPVNTGKQNQAEQKSVDKAPLTGEG